MLSTSRWHRLWNVFALGVGWSFLSSFVTVATFHAAEPPVDNPPATIAEIATAPADGTAASHPATAEFFARVHLILERACNDCHGADLDEPEAGLKLSSRAAMLTGGLSGPALVPGDVDKSLLIDAVRWGKVVQMPPDAPLSAEDVKVLEDWVRAGAIWPGQNEEPTSSDNGAPSTKTFDLAARQASHWCWRPIANPPAPSVPNAVSPVDPIDAFLFDKTHDQNLAAASPATGETWLRRVTTDIAGRLPTPIERADFLRHDTRQTRTELVDRLLASPRFGEHWATMWLDVMAYCESRGHEFDPDIPNVHRYRDYVIDSVQSRFALWINFVREHLAGDLPEFLRYDENDHCASVIATGGFHLGQWLHSPVDSRKDEALRLDDQINVYSKAFLGLTISCARCHDHKFDAISQRDYTATAGIFKSVSYRQARFETERIDHELAAALAKLDHATGDQLRQQLRQSSAPDQTPPSVAEISFQPSGDGEHDAELRSQLPAVDWSAVNRAARPVMLPPETQILADYAGCWTSDGQPHTDLRGWAWFRARFARGRHDSARSRCQSRAARICRYAGNDRRGDIRSAVWPSPTASQGTPPMRDRWPDTIGPGKRSAHRRSR